MPKGEPQPTTLSVSREYVLKVEHSFSSNVPRPGYLAAITADPDHNISEVDYLRTNEDTLELGITIKIPVTTETVNAGDLRTIQDLHFDEKFRLLKDWAFDRHHKQLVPQFKARLRTAVQAALPADLAWEIDYYFKRSNDVGWVDLSRSRAFLPSLRVVQAAADQASNRDPARPDISALMTILKFLPKSYEEKVAIPITAATERTLTDEARRTHLVSAAATDVLRSIPAAAATVEGHRLILTGIGPHPTELARAILGSPRKHPSRIIDDWPTTWQPFAAYGTPWPSQSLH